MLCETVGCLPNPGGLFQQLPGQVKLLETVYRARGKAEADKVKNPNRKSDTDGPEM